MSAFASPEGAAIAPVIQGIVYTALAAFIVFVVAGACAGAWGAQRKGEAVLRGIATGGLKGLGRYVIAWAVLLVAATVLSVAWTAYAFLSVHVF